MGTNKKSLKGRGAILTLKFEGTVQHLREILVAKLGPTGVGRM